MFGDSHELATGIYFNRDRAELRHASRVTIGVQEAFSPSLSLGFFQAICDTPEEANVAHAEHSASVAAAKQVPES